MEKNLVKKIIDEIAEKKLSERVGMSQMGEPFLHPNIVEIVEYAAEKGVNLHIITNASLFNEEILYHIFKAGLNTLLISYHTPDENSFNLFRGATNISYSRYIEGIFKALELKVKRGFQTKIIINLMFTGDNPLKIPRVIDTFEELKLILDMWINTTNSITGKSSLVDSEDFVNRLKKDFNYYNYLELYPGILISVGLVYRWANWLLLKQGIKLIPSVSGYCNMVNERLVLFWDGRCSLCCGDYDGRMTIGDARIESLEKIWINNTQSIKNSMKEKQLLNELCQQCMGRINYLSIFKSLDYRQISNILVNKDLRRLFFWRFNKRRFLAGI